MAISRRRFGHNKCRGTAQSLVADCACYGFVMVSAGIAASFRWAVPSRIGSYPRHVCEQDLNENQRPEAEGRAPLSFIDELRARGLQQRAIADLGRSAIVGVD